MRPVTRIKFPLRFIFGVFICAGSCLAQYLPERPFVPRGAFYALSPQGYVEGEVRDGYLWIKDLKIFGPTGEIAGLTCGIGASLENRLKIDQAGTVTGTCYIKLPDAQPLTVRGIFPNLYFGKYGSWLPLDLTLIPLDKKESFLKAAADSTFVSTRDWLSNQATNPERDSAITAARPVTTLATAVSPARPSASPAIAPDLLWSSASSIQTVGVQATASGTHTEPSESPTFKPPIAEAARVRELEEREAKAREQERLRTAELQAERKRREELEEKLRIAQQLPVVSAVVGKRVALVIGNAAYKQSPLDTPVNDAKDVAAALRVSGFEIQELLNATKTQMLEATRAFERMVLNSDVALVYFAGHGAEVKGKNYMIPVGANIAREYELPEQAYDAAQWLDMLEGVKGTNTKRVNIVILDACRNNELTRSWRSSSNGLAKMDAPVGTFLAYSTAPGKVASDGDRGARNSPFAKHMLNAIKQPNMPIEQVFKRVRSAVIDETKGDQIPWDSSSLVGDFYFTVKK
jgi:hypothetical protein